MNYSEYVDALRREGAATAAAARAAGVDAPVPSCPEWKVADLLQHVGRLHRWVTDVVANDPEDPMRMWHEDTPSGTALLQWFEEGVEPLAATLAASPPDKPAWSWTPDNTVGFWARRQAIELAVHRYDAQLAANTAAPIAQPLAVDGIDEFFALIPYWRGRAGISGAGETLHFHSTDGDGEWLVRVNADGIDVTREHAKGDVAARATASDLMLWLYGRVPTESLEVFGDAALLARWRDVVRW